MFDDTFIGHLFDLVEQTRDAYDETFNYSVIKLIVSTSKHLSNDRDMLSVQCLLDVYPFIRSP